MKYQYIHPSILNAWVHTNVGKKVKIVNGACTLTFVGVIGDHKAFQVVREGTDDRHLLSRQINVVNARLYEGHAAALQQLAKGGRHLVQLSVSH